jgi:hypothetical protein
MKIDKLRGDVIGEFFHKETQCEFFLDQSVIGGVYILTQFELFILK